MSQKNLDRNGRWRNLTIGFRVSPEENESINTRVQLSGLTKQEYLIRRCQEQDIVVVGNPRVFKALKGQMEQILAELRRLDSGNEADYDLLDTIRLVSTTLRGMNEDSV
jgi:hypothetical protein